MELFSIVCVSIGILIIFARGPMVFAPTATLRVYGRLVATKARIRAMGIMMAPFAVALIALPHDQGSAVEFARAFGWLWAAATLWLVATPGSFRRFARGLLDFFESSVDEAIVRIIGFFAVAIGVALIYFGIYVL